MNFFYFSLLWANFHQFALGQIEVMPTRSRNVSVIAAANKYGIINCHINDSSVNGEDFKSYLLNLKQSVAAMGINNPIFILYNARIHHYLNYEKFWSRRE
jgi:hypothetical protein